MSNEEENSTIMTKHFGCSIETKAELDKTRNSFPKEMNRKTRKSNPYNKLHEYEYFYSLISAVRDPKQTD